MTVTTTTAYPTQLAYVPARAGTLYDVLELILDRGMVIDVFVRVSLVGIEILKVDARVVVASVDTYLRFAEACDRVDLERDESSRTVPELFGGGRSVGKRAARSAVGSIGQKVREVVGAGDEEDEEPQEHDEGEQERRPAARKRSAATTRTQARKQAKKA